MRYEKSYERCVNGKVSIIEGEICPDHIHLLVSIPPKMSVSGFMGYLKGKSSMMLYQRYGNMKFAYRSREFWRKGYYVDTVGKKAKPPAMRVVLLFLRRGGS